MSVVEQTRHFIERIGMYHTSFGAFEWMKNAYKIITTIKSLHQQYICVFHFFLYLQRRQR